MLSSAPQPFTPPAIPWLEARPLVASDQLDPGPGVDPALLHSAMERVLAVGGVQALVLFGSRARGEARVDSDLDLAVILTEAQLAPEQKLETWRPTLPSGDRIARRRRGSGGEWLGRCPAQERLPLACARGCGPRRPGAVQRRGLMAPSDDALMLLAIVHRHLRSLRLGLDPAYPDEDWGCWLCRCLRLRLATKRDRSHCRLSARWCWRRLNVNCGVARRRSLPLPQSVRQAERIHPLCRARWPSNPLVLISFCPRQSRPP